MPEIRLLDDNLINKIAAGEIIESPSAVVRELVDNSIDAGATEITVDITNGGISGIIVTDNGSGIEKEQIEKAFMRHATSKIHTEEDLSKILTKGFRGEALASIAAVSMVIMSSRTKDSPVGRRLRMELGDVLEIQSIGMNIGTAIHVNNIFAKIPARRKFLRKPSTESNCICEAVQNFAIGNPNIAFKYINNNNLVLQTSGSGDTINTLVEIHGKNIEDNFLIDEFVNSTTEIELKGYLGNGLNARNTRGLQYLYINNRFIRDPIVIYEIEEAYRGRIMTGKYPAFVLDLNMPPDMLDVNVHPHKSEVRFVDENAIRSLIRKSMKNFFDKFDNTAQETWGKGDFEKPTNINFEPNSLNDLNRPKDKRQLTALFTEEFFKSKHDDVNKFARKDTVKSEETVFSDKDVAYKTSKPTKINSRNETFYNETTQLERIAREVNEFHENLDKKQANKEIIKEINKEIQLELSEKELPLPLPLSIPTPTPTNIKRKPLSEKFQKILNSYEIVGQVFGTYILIESNKSLYMIDQHAAHERVLYEEYYNSLKKESVSSQMLLQPISVNVTPSENEIINENIQIFNDFGFEIEEFGFGIVLIRSVPIILKKIDNGDFFNKILNELKNTNNFLPIENAHELKSDKIASMACKAAIKANQKISNEEVHSLLKKLSELENPFNCPHGRPTIIEMAASDIDKKFKRK